MDNKKQLKRADSVPSLFRRLSFAKITRATSVDNISGIPIPEKGSGGDSDVARPQIISVSRSTDVPAHYMPWMLDQLDQGWVDVYSHDFRYPKQFKRISLSPLDVRCIVWWSKDFQPWIDQWKMDDMRLLRYDSHRFVFTLCSDNADLEPEYTAARGHALFSRLKQLRFLVKDPRLGQNSVVVHFGPIVFYRKLDEERRQYNFAHQIVKEKKKKKHHHHHHRQHKSTSSHVPDSPPTTPRVGRIYDNTNQFEQICEYAAEIEVRHITISFANCNNVITERMRKRGILPWHPTPKQMYDMLDDMLRWCRHYGIKLHCCRESLQVSEYGTNDGHITELPCIDADMIDYVLHRKGCNSLNRSRMRGDQTGTLCKCAASTDIAPSSPEFACPSRCLYCDANVDFPEERCHGSIADIEDYGSTASYDSFDIVRL